MPKEKDFILKILNRTTQTMQKGMYFLTKRSELGTSGIFGGFYLAKK